MSKQFFRPCTPIVSPFSRLSSQLSAQSAAFSPTTFNPHGYAFEHLPIYEARLGVDDLPDVLDVFEHGSITPVRYKRVRPAFGRHGRPSFFPSQGMGMRPRSSAILHLPDPSTLVRSAHSSVARSAFTFRGECGRVVAKYPHPNCGSHSRIHREGIVYEAFPAGLGNFNRVAMRDVAIESSRVIPPPSVPRRGGKLRRACQAIARALKDVATASPLDAPRPGGESDRMATRKALIPPVVPKYFGYYIPANADALRGHPDCGPNGTCSTDWPLPIILMEDCGSPIELHQMNERHRYVSPLVRLISQVLTYMDIQASLCLAGRVAAGRRFRPSGRQAVEIHGAGGSGERPARGTLVELPELPSCRLRLVRRPPCEPGRRVLGKLRRRVLRGRL